MTRGAGNMSKYLLLCMWATALPSVASAAADVLAAERLHLSLSGEGIIDVELAEIPPPHSFDLGLFIGYAHEPLVLYQVKDGSANRLGVPLKNRLGASLVGAYSFLEWLQVGFELPFVLAQGAGDMPAGTGLPGSIAVGGLGDLRVASKFLLFNDEDAGFDGGAVLNFVLPTSFPEQSYLGDGRFQVQPGLLASKRLGELTLGAQLGFSLRGKSTLPGATVGADLAFSIGSAYDFEKLTELPFALNVSLSSATLLQRAFADFNSNPTELLLAGTWKVDEKWRVQLGSSVGLVSGYRTPITRVHAMVRYTHRTPPPLVDGDRDGDGLLDSVDECPAEPEDRDNFEDEDGCPDPDNDKDKILDVDDKCPMEPEDHDDFEDSDGCPDPDNDKDKILDVDDKCANTPEDYDGFEDTDGCPEPDNDRDRILDTVDKCPLEAEDRDNFEDTDGCPEEGSGMVSIVGKKIVLTDKIYFQTALDVIDLKRSKPILDQMSELLINNPWMTKVEIQGHTDDRGNDAYNQDLSQRRAASVAKFLIAVGVAESRLIYVGYGENKPVKSNDSNAGRSANRRVEFVIIEVDEANFDASVLEGDSGSVILDSDKSAAQELERRKRLGLIEETDETSPEPAQP